MHIVYMDESKEDNKFYVYCALIVDANRWNETFNSVKAFRKNLRSTYGIYASHELHAWKFAAGKGRPSDRRLDKPDRAKIFLEVLQYLADAKVFELISSVNENEFYAFERLINRINTNMEKRNSNCLLFCDEGQEAAFTKRLRKMRVHNPIPSRRGAWDGGNYSKSIPTTRIIEDPVFKKSEASYFVQLVDFCAYALLRMERPLDSRTALGYDKMYGALKPICVLAANPKDHRGLGIVR